MKNFKGTQGEWKLTFDNVDEIENKNGIILMSPIKGGDGFSKAVVLRYDVLYGHPRQTLEESKANANLLGSAPELLEALIILKKEYEQIVDSGDCGNWNPRQDNCIVQAKLVINKALGQ